VGWFSAWDVLAGDANRENAYGEKSALALRRVFGHSAGGGCHELGNVPRQGATWPTQDFAAPAWLRQRRGEQPNLPENQREKALASEKPSIGARSPMA
jgi:hypothetical protein